LTAPGVGINPKSCDARSGCRALTGWRDVLHEMRARIPAVDFESGRNADSQGRV